MQRELCCVADASQQGESCATGNVLVDFRRRGCVIVFVPMSSGNYRCNTSCIHGSRVDAFVDPLECHELGKENGEADGKGFDHGRWAMWCPVSGNDSTC